MRPYLRPKLSSSFVSCVSGSGDIWCDMWSVLRNLKYLGQPAAAELATSVFYSWLYNSHTQQHGIELVKLFGLEWNGDFEKLMNHSCNQELSLCKDDPAGSQKYIRESGKVESNFKHLTVRYLGSLTHIKANHIARESNPWWIPFRKHSWRTAQSWHPWLAAAMPTLQ